MTTAKHRNMPAAPRGLDSARAAATLVALLCGAPALAAPAAPDARPTLTLREATRRALEHNPRVRVHQTEIEASQARLAQAGAAPNPEARLVIENFAGTGEVSGFEAAETTLMVSQLVELGGKRAARSALAEAAGAKARAQLEVGRLQLELEVYAAFVHVAGDEHTVGIARAADELAREVLATAQRRVDAGAASKLELHRARIYAGRTRIALEHAEHELLTSRRRLAALWGATEVDFSTLEAEVFRRYRLPAVEELAARVEHHPELQRWALERAARDAEAQAMRAKAVPNLSMGAGARRLERTSDFALVVELGVALPVFDDNAGAARAADLHAQQTSDEERSTHVRLLADLFAAYQELVHATTELEALESEIIPEAQQVLALLRDGFERGRYTQLEVLEAARTLTEVQGERVNLAVEYHRLLGTVESVINGPVLPGDRLARLDPATPPTPSPGATP